MKHSIDNPVTWMKAGKWIFIAIMVYCFWYYIALLLIVCGAAYVWQEWQKK